MRLYDSHTHILDDASTLAIKNIELKLPFVFPDIKKGQFFSLGIHPWYTGAEDWIEQIEILKFQLSQANLIAIGECGLDKAIELDFDSQKSIFAKQVELSEEYSKPIIVHAVRSYNEILDLRKAMQAKQTWLIHDFNSSPEMAQELINTGCVLSFGKRVLNLSSRLEKVLDTIAVDKLLIESDEDRHLLPEIYNNIAMLKGLSQEELVASQRINFYRTFKLKKP